MALFQQLPAQKSQRNQTWILGLDLGSTFSAAAYCLTSDSTDRCDAGRVRTIQGYKSLIRNRSDILRHLEVPTKVRYESTGNIRYGWDAVKLVEKGFDHNIPGLMIDLFKPGLDEKNETREERRHIEDLLVRLQAELDITKSVDEVVTDFLVKFLGHVKSQLDPRGYRDSDSVQLICTVPAMWSIRAKRRTVKAVQAAAQLCHFTLRENVTVISEPEAATAYVQRMNEHHQFTRGDSFIVCDAGGVTVDVITYMVYSVKPLLLKQVVRSKGDFCGSSFLNQRFESHIRKRLEDAEYRTAHQLHTTELENDIKTAISIFEFELKRDYGDELHEIISDLSLTGLGGDGGEMPLQWMNVHGVKADPEKGFREDAMAITRSDMKIIFEPILERCWNLVAGQIRDAYREFHEPNKVVLVGGLGGNPQLKSYFEKQCNEWIQKVENINRRRPISVIVPEAPQRECNRRRRGSRALQEDMVKDYISRSSICICSHDPYNPRQKAHEDATFVLDLFEGRRYVHNCVKILLRTDQMIPSSGIKKLTALHRTIPIDEEVFFLTLDIYELEDDNGLDDYPLTHPKNQGYLLLETVAFKVDVAPIRDKLKLTLLGGSTHVDQPISSSDSTNPVTDDGSTLRGGKRVRKICSRKLTNKGLHSAVGDAAQSVSKGSYYYWVDYRVEVEFRDGLMSYHLLIDGVEDDSYRGSVNLGPSTELWKE